MSNLPKLITQVTFTYGKILGKAFVQAGRQAYKNTQYKPDAVASDSSPEDTKGGTSSTAGIDRTTNMRLAEARLILNVKEDAPWEKIKAQYDHLFLQNAPPAPPPVDPDAPPAPKPTKPVKKAATPTGSMHSFYLQSKVFRAMERLEAEKRLAEGETLEGEEEPVVGKEGEVKEGEEVKTEGEGAKKPEGEEPSSKKGEESKGP